jgi:hypothetical protein
MTDSNGANDSMVLERSFDASAELVWQMWTDPKHFKAWYGPDGASITVAGTTRMRLTHVGIAAGSPGAVGWTMALDKLAARLQASVIR